MLVIGIAGPQLAEEERDWLRHPGVGGVILFSRNVQSRELTRALCRGFEERQGCANF